MIECVAKIEPTRCRLDMTGHAGFNPGQDIVCAGASAIVTGLSAWIQNAGNYVKGDTVVQLEPGEAHFDVRGGEAVRQAFLQAVMGLGCIELMYPENISVIIE